MEIADRDVIFGQRLIKLDFADNHLPLRLQQKIDVVATVQVPSQQHVDLSQVSHVAVVIGIQQLMREREFVVKLQTSRG